MLEKEFEMWYKNTITKETLVKHDLHIRILGYLKKVFFYFIELSNSSTKENKQIIRLDTSVTIANNNQQLNLPDLNDVKAKRVKTKKKKAQR